MVFVIIGLVYKLQLQVVKIDLDAYNEKQDDYLHIVVADCKQPRLY
jgi:hypothetical protein